MYRVFILVVLLLVVAGCTSQFTNRTVDDGLGGRQKLFFAYGKFCGGGNPMNIGRVGLDGQARTLLSLYPPVDDVDAICYAHDQCFRASGANKLKCDDVIQRMLFRYQSKIKAKGCWDLVSDINIAFMGKIYEMGDSTLETWTSRVKKTVIGMPVALFWMALKAPAKWLTSGLVEGTCNVAEQPRPEALISEFTQAYKNTLFSNDTYELNIPVPSVENTKGLHVRAPFDYGYIE